MSEVTQFTMRIENELYEKIKASADKNKRSIAKEIEYHLEQAFENDAPRMLEEIYNFADDFKFDYQHYFDKIDEILEIVKNNSHT